MQIAQHAQRSGTRWSFAFVWGSVIIEGFCAHNEAVLWPASSPQMASSTCPFSLLLGESGEGEGALHTFSIMLLKCCQQKLKCKKYYLLISVFLKFRTCLDYEAKSSLSVVFVFPKKDNMKLVCMYKSFYECMLKCISAVRITCCVFSNSHKTAAE